MDAEGEQQRQCRVVSSTSHLPLWTDGPVHQNENPTTIIFRDSIANPSYFEAVMRSASQAQWESSRDGRQILGGYTEAEYGKIPESWICYLGTN